MKDFFEVYFPTINDEIPNLIRDFFKNPTSALVTTKCYHWVHGNTVALIGDSAHAIVPFYGQGMNAGFEDITTLNHLMNVHGDDWGTIFQEYQKERKPNADAIAELSYRNFMEMSSKTASVVFNCVKRLKLGFRLNIQSYGCLYIVGLHFQMIPMLKL